jgi:hypothetical protein
MKTKAPKIPISVSLRVRPRHVHMVWGRGVYRCVSLFKKTEALENRLKMYEVVMKWNFGLDPVCFIESGKEPDVGYEPFAPPPKMIETVVCS